MSVREPGRYVTASNTRQTDRPPGSASWQPKLKKNVEKANGKLFLNNHMKTLGFKKNPLLTVLEMHVL